MKIFTYSTLLIFLVVAACQEPTEIQQTVANTPAEGFNLQGSDTEAIAIADSVMAAMGGRQNWDNTRFIQWTFFGRRTLFWDKQTGNVMVEMPSDSLSIFLNVYDESKGVVEKNGVAFENKDSIQQYTDRGKSIWINDSYWLVMPFKLKDSGVTLKYVGEEVTDENTDADVLELTFEEVGKTPENKYWVYVDQSDHLVKQWDFFRNATDSIPGISTPWKDYKPYGNILLSGNRGRGQLTDIAVFDELPVVMQNMPLFNENS